MRILKALSVGLWLGLASDPGLFAEERRLQLEYQPAPIDNPLKGLVPYSGDVRSRFPHSLEFNYVAFADLVKGYEQYDWTALEELLNDVASRGHQAVFRIYLEYPKRTGVIPPFLVKDGLKVHKYLNTNTQPFPPAAVETPDYENEKLRTVLRQFIAAFGKKYDGDPRIGFITAGLLGTWGEWHTYPREELFASKTVQSEVLESYAAAFRVTPILLRYPAGPDDEQKAENASRPFGYHDDSFAWATLDTGKPSDDWFFMSALKSAGPEAFRKWQHHPIGGEIRPEAWGKVFDLKPGHRQIQNFRRCVAETHASWLMDSGMFEKQQQPDRIDRAREEVRRMGYEFHVQAVTINDSVDKHLDVTLELENRGVAPFYYDWPTEFGLIAGDKLVWTTKCGLKLKGLLPGGQPRIAKDQLDLTSITAGTYQLALRVPNPLPKGHPVRFANTTQDANLTGWLTLGQIRLR